LYDARSAVPDCTHTLRVGTTASFGRKTKRSAAIAHWPARNHVTVSGHRTYLPLLMEYRSFGPMLRRPQPNTRGRRTAYLGRSMVAEESGSR